MTLRVFVVRELFPFTAGGIGRVAANILATSTPAELANTAVVYLAAGLTRKRFEAVYPGVTFVDASPESYQTLDARGHRYPPANCYTTSMLHAESVRAMQALIRLEAEKGPLGYIEFGDWGANAFAACQEKRLGRGLKDATIAVRLHSTDSVLGAIESRYTDVHALALYDLERKALADCDLIVAQLDSVARKMQQFYAFADDAWLPRLVVHAPPVIVDGIELARESIKPDMNTSIVFSSKIQRLKRPDVFVRGCVGFLRKKPEFKGEVIFLAHAFDPEYQAQIERLIPWGLRDRFRFVSGAGERERAATIARGICVFPTIWESFCLAAYEASLAGALCLVNSTNPSFDEHSPWIEGRNCEKFDGTPDGLAECLLRVFGETAAAHEIVEVPADPKPWDRCGGRSHGGDERRPLVSVLIPHFNLGTYLHRTIDSVLASTYTNLELVIVDDASTEVVSQAVIERLAALGDPRFRVVRSEVNSGLAATRNIGLAHCRGEYVVPLDADDIISPEFIATAVHGLLNNPDYDFVVPQIAYFEDGRDGELYSHPELSNSYVFIGEARASGLHMNRFSTATMMARLSTLTALRYREELESYEDWELYLRATLEGHRMLVTNSVEFFYRRRGDSMVHSAAGRARHRLAYHDILRDKSMTLGGMSLPAYALEGFISDSGSHVAAGESATELRAKLAEYEQSEVVFAALTVARQLQRRAPWLLAFGRRAARMAWRTAKRFR